MRQSPPVFVYAYHKVLPKKDFDIGIPLFEFHLKVFKKFFHVLSWEEFKAYLRGEFVPPKRAVFLTFDDGYADNYVYAYPLLKKYGLKAHLFVIPSRISEKPLRRKTLFDYWKGKVSLGELYKPKPMWEANREFFLKGESEDFLTWDELDEMKDVFSFGSHGISHSQGFISDRLEDFVDEGNINRIYSLWKIYSPPKAGYPIFERKSDLTAPVGRVKEEVLKFCESFPKKRNWKAKLEMRLEEFLEPLVFESFDEYLKRIREELKTSKEIIEGKLGAVVDSFSYPWGDYSEVLTDEVGKVYDFAFTVKKGRVSPEVNPLLIPRVYAVKDIFTFLGHLWRFGR